MLDVRSSIPRTPAQHVLMVVSVLMALLGALVTAALVIGLVTALTGMGAGTPAADPFSTIGFSVVVAVVAALLFATAWLGLAASRDSSRVGPFRFLCNLVGLVTLVAIAWSWGAGSFILFDPIVLFTTVVYVIVCASLADQVQKEHDQGIVGTTYLRSRDQRVLHLLSSVMVFTSVMKILLAIVLWFALPYLPADAMPIETAVPYLVVGLVSSANELLVGWLGLRGSDVPKHIKPFTILVGLGFAFNVFSLVLGIILYGLGAIQVGQLQDLLWLGGCLYLAVRIWRQPPLEAPGSNN